MKTQHTPGPWAVGCPDGKTHYIMVGGHTEIANLPHCRAESSYAIEDGFERRANADLIAAAPDLLAALEDSEFLLRKAAQVSGPIQDSFRRSAEDARAAIAKARGEA